MQKAQFFENFLWITCPSPATAPKYSGNVLESLTDCFDEISPNFINWFGSQLEQGPFQKGFHLVYCNTKTLLSYKEAESRVSRIANEEVALMQILIGAPDVSKRLQPMLTVLAFPAELHKGEKCQVVFRYENGKRKLLLEVFNEYENLPAESGLLFASQASVLPEGLSTGSVDNRVPFLKSEGLA